MTHQQTVCKRCGGTGWLEPIGPKEDGSYITSRPCGNCDGDGKSRDSVYFLVGDVIKPAPEPFMVLRVDTAVRRENGVEGTVQSLHITREEADAEAERLTAIEAGSIQ